MGVGKRKVHKNRSMAISEKGSTRYWNYLEDHWNCVGGLSAMSAIGTQLRDSMNSGLARWRLKVYNIYVDAVAESGRNPASKHQIDD